MSAESNQYKFTNRLIHEKSPYLLQHAHNPSTGTLGGERRLRKRAASLRLSSCPSAIRSPAGLRMANTRSEYFADLSLITGP